MRIKGSATKRRGVHLPVLLEYVDSTWPLTAIVRLAHLGRDELTFADLEAHVGPVNCVDRRRRKGSHFG